jgi:hypothetical protein
MPKSIHIRIDEDQYDELSDFKDRRGYTWKGLLLEGYRALDTDETTG